MSTYVIHCCVLGVVAIADLSCKLFELCLSIYLASWWEYYEVYESYHFVVRRLHCKVYRVAIVLSCMYWI